MKEHKWYVSFIEVVYSNNFTIQGTMKSSDGRRKEHAFSFTIERNTVTLDQVADAFRDGDKMMKIAAMPKARKKKCVAPTVDERQLNLPGMTGPDGGSATADGSSIETQAGSGTSSPF